MPYTVEKLPDMPAVLVSLQGQFNWNAEHTALNQKVAALIDALEADGHIYRVTDFSAITLDFATIVQALAAETEGTPGSVSDPRLSQIYVGPDELVQFAAQSVQQTQYGKLEVLHFPTLDEAMTFLNALYGDLPV